MGSIPRTLHRIWLGGNMPPEFEAYGESWRRHHPAWRHVLWTEQNLPRLVNQREFDQAGTLAQKADIARYEILYDEGGVYVDCDFECYKPVDELIEGVHCFAATEDETWVSIGILGAVAQHPLLRATIEEIPKSIASQPSAPVNIQTGPLLFTRVVTARRMRLERDDLVVFPPKIFYPYRFGQKRPRLQEIPDAYGAHHWAASWMRSGELGPNTQPGPAPVLMQPNIVQAEPDVPSPSVPTLRNPATSEADQLETSAAASSPAATAASSANAAPAAAGPAQSPAASGEHAAADSSAKLRVLVALDPDRSDPVLLLLVAFGRLFRSGEPVELGIYAYSEPSLPLLQCVQQLLGLVIGDLSTTAELSLLSRPEIAALPYDVAFVPTGHAIEDARALYDAVQGLQWIRALLDARAQGEPGPLLAPPLARDELLRRIAKRPTAPLAPPAADAGSTAHKPPAIRGTYLGDDRILVHTTYGRPIVASARDRSLTPELLVSGCCELPLLRFLTLRLAPGDVVFDIGANIGLFTVLMGTLVGSEGRVVAYEAAPAPFALLVENVTMNGMNDRVTTAPRAAWSEAKQLVFHTSERFFSNGSVRAKDEAYRKMYPIDRVRSLEVDAEPLDLHWSNLERIELVKIDVEGSEYQVLRGMDGMLRAGVVRSVVFECVRAELDVDWDPLIQLLHALQKELNMGFSTLSEDGKLRPLELSVLAAHGNFTQVVMERRA